MGLGPYLDPLAHIGLAQTQPVDSSNNKDSTQPEPDLAQPSVPELFSLTLWVACVATPLMAIEETKTMNTVKSFQLVSFISKQIQEKA